MFELDRITRSRRPNTGKFSGEQNMAFDGSIHFINKGLSSLLTKLKSKAFGSFLYN